MFTAILICTLGSLIAVDAQAMCSQNGSTWECSGFIQRQGIDQAGQYTSPSNAGLHVYSGDIDIHILPGGYVTTAGAGMSSSADGISNNYFGMTQGNVYSLHVLNDGEIVGANRGGANFAVELSLAPQNLLGPVTFDNNGLIQGVQAAFSVNSRGVFTLNNSATGIVRANTIGLNIGAPGSVIDNHGIIEVLDPANGFAIGGTHGTDTVSLYDGKIVGNVLLGDGTDVFNWYKGTLNGNLYLGNGSDKILVSSPTFDSSVILDGGDDVSTADGMVDELTFSGITTDVKGANLLNWERIVVDNSELTVLDSSVVTATTPGDGLVLGNGGTMHVGDGFTLSGRATLLAGGTFDLKPGATGTATINGDVTNSGVLSTTNGVVGNSIVINGDYTGQGGHVRLDTSLGDDASPTDMLRINGNTSGSSYLKVVNAGGTGAQTTEGIKVIEVGGASLGTFTLLGDYVQNGQQVVVQGAYGYRLYHGVTSSPADGNWYLRSQLTDPPNPPQPGTSVTPQYQPGVPLYEAYPRVLLSTSKLPTLQQRIGNRSWNLGSGTGTETTEPTEPAPKEASRASESQGSAWIEENGLWARAETVHARVDAPVSTSDMQYSLDYSKIQVGIDGLLLDNDHGKLIGGVTLHYLTSGANISSAHATGTLDTSGVGFGGTLTWYGDNGFYLDGQAALTWLKSDFHSSLTGYTLAHDVDALTYALSIEAGQRLWLDKNWSMTPQAQLSFTGLHSGRFTDIFKANIDPGGNSDLTGRLGLAVDYENSWKDDQGETHRLKAYGIANLYYHFLDDTEIQVADATIRNGIDGLSGGLGLGASYNWSDDKYSIYAEGMVDKSLADFSQSHYLKATAGLRVKW